MWPVNDDDQPGSELINILIQAHCYWIREADIDGFRVDAVKHMGELAVARFAQAMREYAYSLGKHDFFLFGELVGGDDAINRYAGPNTEGQRGDRTVFYGLNSVLDFPLYWVLPGVIRGSDSPANLFHRYDSLRERAISRGELGRYLVTFIDNHDQIGQNWKRRFAAGLKDEQVVAAIEKVRVDETVIRDASPRSLRVRTIATGRDDYLAHPPAGERLRDADARAVAALGAADRGRQTVPGRRAQDPGAGRADRPHRALLKVTHEQVPARAECTTQSGRGEWTGPRRCGRRALSVRAGKQTPLRSGARRFDRHCLKSS